MNRTVADVQYWQKAQYIFGNTKSNMNWESKSIKNHYFDCRQKIRSPSPLICWNVWVNFGAVWEPHTIYLVLSECYDSVITCTICWQICLDINDARMEQTFMVADWLYDSVINE